MLQVRDSMSREIVTLSPDETAATALALCRERRIRHLPVLREGILVGIVSDRDLRSSTPALGDPARAAALQKVLVEDVMTMEVAIPDRPGTLAGAAGVFGMCGINIESAAMGPTREPKEGAFRERVVVFRVDTINTTEV